MTTLQPPEAPTLAPLTEDDAAELAQVLAGSPGVPCDFPPSQHVRECGEAVVRFSTVCGNRPHGMKGCADIHEQFLAVDFDLAGFKLVCRNCLRPVLECWSVAPL